MKLLIIGGTGMLGHKLFQKLGEEYPDTYCTVRKDVESDPFSRIPFFQTEKVFRDVDVQDEDRLRTLAEQLQPDYILNCVGIIKQRTDNLSELPCITLNALLPHQLADIAASYGGRVIHFSTDCVFDGKKGMYTERDLPDATDIYGRTKALGELVYDHTLTIRSSIIGRELCGHASLLDWFLAQDGASIRGFTHAIYSGVTTNQMAKIVQQVIEKRPKLSGLYHVVANPINKFDLLMAAKAVFGLSVEIEPYEDFYMDRSMSGDRFNAEMGYVSPDWDVLLKDIAAESDVYKKWGIEL